MKYSDKIEHSSYLNCLITFVFLTISFPFLVYCFTKLSILLYNKNKLGYDYLGDVFEALDYSANFKHIISVRPATKYVGEGVYNLEVVYERYVSCFAFVEFFTFHFFLNVCFSKFKPIYHAANYSYNIGTDSYIFTINTNDFPKMKENQERYEALSVKQKKYKQEKKRLREEYEYHLQGKLISDIPWATSNQELKEIKQELSSLDDEMSFKLQELTSEIERIRSKYNQKMNNLHHRREDLQLYLKDREKDLDNEKHEILKIDLDNCYDDWISIHKKFLKGIDFDTIE